MQIHNMIEAVLSMAFAVRGMSNVIVGLRALIFARKSPIRISEVTPKAKRVRSKRAKASSLEK